MNKVKQLGNSLVIRHFAGLLVSVTAQSEETESVIVSAQGHGVITSGIEKVKITTALVVLRKNGTAMITVTSDLQRELKQRNQSIPIVFITAQGDDTVRPQLIAQGASECLFKPFEPTEILRAINTALQAS